MRRQLGRVVGGLLLALLIVSVGLNVYLYRLTDRYYRQLNTVRLDPLGMDSFPAQPEMAPLAQPIVLFYGDSRAQQWPAPSDLPQFTFINRGIGSQTSAQVALRFEAHVTPIQPDVLVVQVCVNDLKTIPLFPENRETIVDTCKANIDKIVADAQAVGAVVVLTTIFPVGEPPLQRRPVWSSEIAAAINTVNQHIRSLDVPVLDAYHLLADERGLLNPAYSVDELHLNPAGYALLNTELRRLLLTIRDE